MPAVLSLQEGADMGGAGSGGLSRVLLPHGAGEKIPDRVRHVAGQKPSERKRLSVLVSCAPRVGA